MAFDWVSFLQQYNIDHVTSGHNARRGWLGCKCPWCGDDPSHHLGINITNGIYHCFRGNHKGRSPYRLISALLGCSHSEAVSIYGKVNTFDRSESTFLDDALTRLGMTVKPKSYYNGPADILNYLPEFVPVQDRGLCYRLAYPYLKDRLYTYDDIEWLSHHYQLMFAYSGVFAYRIIIPVIVNQTLVNWTGRSISKTERLRYKSLSTDPEKASAQNLPVAITNIKNTLFDYDDIVQGGRILVVAEGPFDAMRVRLLGGIYGIRATCLFGKEISQSQIHLLDTITPYYDKIVALFDINTDFDIFLSIPDYINITQLSLPSGIKDPAELSEKQFRGLFRLK